MHPTWFPLSLLESLTVQGSFEGAEFYDYLQLAVSDRDLWHSSNRVGPLHIHSTLADVAVIALSHFDTVGAATSIGEQPVKGLLDPGAGARLTVAESLTNLMFASVTDIKFMTEVVNGSCWRQDSLSMAARVETEVIKAPGRKLTAGHDVSDGGLILPVCWRWHLLGIVDWLWICPSKKKQDVLFIPNYRCAVLFPTKDVCCSIPSYRCAVLFPTTDVLFYSQLQMCCSIPNYQMCCSIPNYRCAVLFPTKDVCCSIPSYRCAVLFPTTDVLFYSQLQMCCSIPIYRCAVLFPTKDVLFNSLIL
ncbi:hypothetical protein Btru_075290 [Bulinus truncatus]|nr:hypothetical protein Btru_075290 [Bulinus truncatus]